MSPFLAEFIGTLILILLGNGVVANVVLARTKGQGSGWIVIALGWGMAVFVAVWCVGLFSGAHINPAVTIGLAAANKFEWAAVPHYIAAQMLGAIGGAILVFLFYRDHYASTDDPAAKLATFCTAPAIPHTINNLFCEVTGTMVLVLAVLLSVEPSIVAATEPAAGATPPSMTLGLGTLGALPVGLLVLAIGLSLGGTTGYAINPARDLGPRIAHAILPIPGKGHSNWSYAWIPVVGPILGALIAAIVMELAGWSAEGNLTRLHP
jgi:glycerol uptake facilitator protein